MLGFEPPTFIIVDFDDRAISMIVDVLSIVSNGNTVDHIAGVLLVLTLGKASRVLFDLFLGLNIFSLKSNK